LAQKLGVQVLFEGTVREDGSRIRVTSRIVKADGFQLWSQRFDAEADSSNLFTLQEQFASALVNRMRPQQSIIRESGATASPAIFGVYSSTLNGEALLEEETIADVQAALAKFREITEITPRYARPYCGIAQCYCWMALHGAPRSADLAASARVAADRAIELDPKMLEALATKGTVQTLEWDWQSAASSFERAIELGSHATGDRQYARFLTLLGRFDEAWLYLESAQQIDPFSSLQKTACAKFFYLSRRYEEALEHFTEPQKYGPLPPAVHLYLAMIHIQLGQREDAKTLARLLQRNAGAHAAIRGWIAEIFAWCKETALAATIVQQFKLLSADVQLSKYRQALLSIALDDPQASLAFLSASYAEKESELPFLTLDPRFDRIRKNPQFHEIVERVQSTATA
jgi:tetratricopeptide (TPR) repeat protein